MFTKQKITNGQKWLNFETKTRSMDQQNRVPKIAFTFHRMYVRVKKEKLSSKFMLKKLGQNLKLILTELIARFFRTNQIPITILC